MRAVIQGAHQWACRIRYIMELFGGLAGGAREPAKAGGKSVVRGSWWTAAALKTGPEAVRRRDGRANGRRGWRERTFGRNLSEAARGDQREIVRGSSPEKNTPEPFALDCFASLAMTSSSPSGLTRGPMMQRNGGFLSELRICHRLIRRPSGTAVWVLASSARTTRDGMGRPVPNLSGGVNGGDGGGLSEVARLSEARQYGFWRRARERREMGWAGRFRTSPAALTAAMVAGCPRSLGCPRRGRKGSGVERENDERWDGPAGSEPVRRGKRAAMVAGCPRGLILRQAQDEAKWRLGMRRSGGSG